MDISLVASPLAGANDKDVWLMAAKKKSQGVLGVYVICGKDKFLAGSECEALMDRLLPVDQRAMALYQPRAEDANIAEVLDELRTMPFLAEKRVVLIKDADPFISDNREYLENTSTTPAHAAFSC